MHSKGITIRKIKHPMLQDSTNITFVVKQRKWKCTNCGAYDKDHFPFFDSYKQSSNITPLLVLNAMKDLDRSTASIARQFYLSDTQVHNIFTAYVDLPRLPLPRCLSVDEVYFDISEKEKYAFVLMDFETGEIIDILHNRWTDTISSYFYDISLEERKKVEYLISDGYSTYLNFPQHYFPNATSILDSFHVSKYLINMLNVYLNDLLKRYRQKQKKELEEKNYQTNQSNQTIKDSKEIILLKKYRWVLLKNQSDIHYSSLRHYHSALSMYLDTYTIEKMFFALDPNLAGMRILKEKYIAFNKECELSHLEKEQALEELIQEYLASEYILFRKFSAFLKVHKTEIINSFTSTYVVRKTVDDQVLHCARLSNGPIESFNRKPKDYKRNARGFSNFHYTRNRILWATRKNRIIRNTPKSDNEIHSYTGKQRGSYKKKK